MIMITDDGLSITDAAAATLMAQSSKTKMLNNNNERLNEDGVTPIIGKLKSYNKQTFAIPAVQWFLVDSKCLPFGKILVYWATNVKNSSLEKGAMRKNNLRQFTKLTKSKVQTQSNSVGTAR
uniref:Uncharacterized protein n=1 Tax=Proboscia inermis TaxID=420281 RepID=A0A7S0C587_9STRA|mmetsp:Transcript_2732/g.2753  ORF Transcript_2732/g.2753 Transcript_2732/m.2753 type:complete len:122 (+) Transcript_2732:3-368(+)